MTVVASSTSTSRLIPRRPGQRSKSWKPSRSKPPQSIFLRDRDAIYGHGLQQQTEALGITEVLGACRSPWQRAYIERIIGSIRRDCLDHVIVFDQTSLRRILGSYLDYYHRSRTHLSLNKDTPVTRSVQSAGRIVAIPQVGGLHHRYERLAA
ncbi:MAG TPA: integrase core domain-containing protein [Terriglobia bacterium]|nr:integrase core domain-containing protein [Terriglobia bacterium]